MKTYSVTNAAILCLLLGVAAPAFSQQEQKGEKHTQPESRQGKGQRAKPEHQQPNHNNQQAGRAGHQQQRQGDKHRQTGTQGQPPHNQAKRQQRRVEPQQQRRSNKQAHSKAQPLQQQHSQPQRTPEQQRVQQSTWQQHRSQRWESDHRTWQQRGGYNGYRIPDNRYRGYFGQNHGFRIYGLPFLVVGGYPRFQYGGYWLTLVDPWPEYWANDWYDTDDVYVTYVDQGYYMYNRRYPTVGIAINISR